MVPKVFLSSLRVPISKMKPSKKNEGSDIVPIERSLKESLIKVDLIEKFYK